MVTCQPLNVQIAGAMMTHANPTMAQPNVRTPAASTGPLGPQAPGRSMYLAEVPIETKKALWVDQLLLGELERR